jgi:hypothetical protein
VTATAQHGREDEMRLLRGSVLALIALLTLVLPVAAGGWASAAIDSGPIDPTAGTPVEIGFVLKQHGVTPISWEMVTFNGQNIETGEQVSVEAQPKGPVGHYVATVTFPSAGSWRWSLLLRDLLLDETTFPTITVRPAGAPAPSTPTAIPTELIVAALALAVGLGLAGSLLLRRRETPIATGRAAATDARTEVG